MIDLFDKHGKVIPLTDEQLAELPPGIRPHVEKAISTGAELEAANAAVTAADDALTHGLKLFEAAAKARPKITHTDIAREWIASERAKILA